jgi:cathepsin L
MKGFKCPISPGSVELDLDLTLSSAIPAKLARVTIELTAQSDTGDKALCVKINTSPENLVKGVNGDGEEVLRDYSSYDFDAYVNEFKKVYSEKEFQQRKATFDSSVEKIVQHNQEFHAGKHSWYAAVSEITDLSKDEFAKLRATSLYAPSTHPIVLLEAEGSNPDSVDWRTKNVVTKVKNQGGCGSCWAFSATETVESAYAIATGKLLELAPQTYVNCVKNPHRCGGTGGCEGATMELAFNLTRDTGIALESDLEYRGVDGACTAYKPAVKISGYVKNPVNNAFALETAVATKGPQSITVAAQPWFSYGGGIFDGCSSSGDSTLDHGVQLVGYTKEAWIVRNSWGPNWGEKGYIRISRASDSKTFKDTKPSDGVACYPYPEEQTVGGECGILFDTSYPTGAALADLTIVV